MMLMRPLGGGPLVIGTSPQPIPHTDPLNHKHAIEDLDVPLRLGLQKGLAGLDPTRLQRASSAPPRVPVSQPAAAAIT
jgi:hypothetical protein